MATPDPLTRRNRFKPATSSDFLLGRPTIDGIHLSLGRSFYKRSVQRMPEQFRQRVSSRATRQFGEPRRHAARYNMGAEAIVDVDAQVCYCFHVSQRKLLNFLRLEKPRVASQLSECGGAGTGCGWCIPFLKQLFQQASEGGATALEQLTPAEYERLRAVYIREGKGTPPPGATPLPPPQDKS
jgi:bacterioferritin-associated ferredoxin